jgi:prolyl oligopeptidase
MKLRWPHRLRGDRAGQMVAYLLPGHSFKFAARLQEMQMGDAPVLIRIQTKAGQGAGKPTGMIIQEQADRCAPHVSQTTMDRT